MAYSWKAFIGSLLVASAGTGVWGADQTIHLALTTPLTGDYAEYGNNFKRSVELAIAEINGKGGVLGRKMVLDVGDSKGDPKESAILAQKWTTDPTILAEIGDFTSSCCMAGQPIYNRAGMIQLSPTASHTDSLCRSTGEIKGKKARAAAAPSDSSTTLASSTVPVGA